MSLSGTNSYMGDDPNLNILNSPLANAPPDAEMEGFDFLDEDSAIFSDIILAEISTPNEMTNSVLPITEDASNNLKLIENCVENTHVFDAIKTEKNPQVENNQQTQTEPKTNFLAIENFSKFHVIKADSKKKELNLINISHIKENNLSSNTMKIESKPSTLTSEISFKDFLRDDVVLVKVNHDKQQFKIVHREKIPGTLSKNDPNVFFMTVNGISLMTSEQKELHGKNIGVYSFSNKNMSSLNIENIKRNFKQENIFVCTDNQFKILNDKLMKNINDEKKAKDEKHVKHTNKENEPSETQGLRDAVLMEKIGLKIDTSLKTIYNPSSKKADLEKEEKAIKARDDKKFREKKELLERETNKIITERIDKKIQLKNKPKH